MCLHIAHRLSPPRGGLVALALVAASLTVSQPAIAAPLAERPIMDFQTGAPYPVLIAPDMAERVMEAPLPRPEPRAPALRQPGTAPVTSAPPVVEVDMRSAPKPGFRMPWQIGVFQ